MITEIFVSIDNLTFTKLDLFKDESIPMKYTTKDLQDISKVFSPYSQNFTFEATPKNRQALGFFGDTDVIKINPDAIYKCKIYTDGSLNLNGNLTIESLQYENQMPTYFTAGFSTSMKDLKSRMGDTLISDLGSLEIDWKPLRVYQLLQGKSIETVNSIDVRYFVPLISNNRVLSSDPTFTAGLKDNIAYNIANTPTSINLLKSDELRPAISYSSLIEMIKQRYNLQVLAPLDSRPEYRDAYVWCNSESFYSAKETRLEVVNELGNIFVRNTKNEGDIPDPKKYVPTANILDKSFNVIIQQFQNEWYKHFTFEMQLDNLVLSSSSSETPTMVVKIIRTITDEVLISQTFDIVGTSLNAQIDIGDEYFIANNLDFYVTLQFNQPTSWSNMGYAFYFLYYDGKYGAFNSKRYATYVYESLVNNNSDLMGGTTINLFKSLPPIKVIDFLTSYFKTFNINMYDTSPNNDDLFWLTPSDINSEGNEYSKAEVDYTKYIDFQSFKKETSSDFNYYNFKHATSKYKSNIDYLTASGQEYGQVTYPAVKPDDVIEFKVETIYTLMVPVILNGTSDVVTYYGFGNDKPEILETGESRYKPNYGELTIFYLNENTALSVPLGFQNQEATGILVNSKLTNYLKCLPFNGNNKSLAFSVLVWLNTQYPDSLYSRYYSSQILRLLDPNVLSQEYKGILPPDELYLNNATTIQGGGNTPKGFRLQNDIIIGENRFSILDADIDITTGKCSFTLLNY